MLDERDQLAQDRLTLLKRALFLFIIGALYNLKYYVRSPTRRAT